MPDDSQTKRVTRKELYHQVWSTPLRKLAPEQYGISDVALAKICKQYKIPRPPRGYWAQKAAGVRMEKPPLPRGDDRAIIKIDANPERVSESELKKVVAVSSSSGKPAPITVPSELNNPHPLIAQTEKILSTCNPDHRGILATKDKSCLDIQVSKDCLKRALILMDTLIKSLENRGHGIILDKGKTIIKVGDVELPLGLSEETKRRPLEPQDLDLDRHYYDFGYKLFFPDPSPNGTLCLSIKHLEFWPHGELQQHWKDTQSQRLEDCLHRFEAGLLKIVALTHKKRAEKQQRNE